MITTERESTVYARIPLTVEWGSLTDITETLVAAEDDPDTRPSGWVAAILIENDTHPLWRGQEEVAVLIGPPEPDDERTAQLRHSVGSVDSPKTYQLWAAIGTEDEWIVDRVGVWEVT